MFTVTVGQPDNKETCKSRANINRPFIPAPQEKRFELKITYQILFKSHFPLIQGIGRKSKSFEHKCTKNAGCKSNLFCRHNFWTAATAFIFFYRDEFFLIYEFLGPNLS